MREEEVIVFLMSLMILAGVAVLWMAMQSRRRIREMEHRERLAMIERGLIPSPELDPGGFERRAGIAPALESSRAARSRSAGVIMIGFGLALMMLISFAAGTPGVGIGVGGAFALLGAAFLFNAMLSRSEPEPLRPSGRPPQRRDAEAPLPPTEP